MLSVFVIVGAIGAPYIAIMSLLHDGIIVRHALLWGRSDMTDVHIALPRGTNRVPLWLKVAYLTFMAVLVPVYWHYYGPTNFLIFAISRSSSRS